VSNALDDDLLNRVRMRASLDAIMQIGELIQVREHI
jgi:hypothetical protein